MNEVLELMRRVSRLELAARHNAAAWLKGDYLTSIRGQGMIFHESRRYVAGEPARHIDWNVTARAGEPYVKVHLEERRRDVMLVVDVSPSMHTGFQQRTKLEVAIELAATLAVSAVEAGDRVGLVVFADRVLSELRPGGGRAQLFRVLRALLENTEPWQRPVEESDPRVAIHSLQRSRNARFVVLMISDFIDHDLPDDLRYLRSQHDVSLLHVYDPLELASGPVVIQGRSPEGGNRGTFVLGEGDDPEALRRFFHRHAGRHRIATVSIGTDLPVRAALDRFFHHKRRLQTRAR